MSDLELVVKIVRESGPWLEGNVKNGWSEAMKISGILDNCLTQRNTQNWKEKYIDTS